MRAPTTTWAIALKEQVKLEEAIEAYNKALTIKPDYADAYNNMGNALKEQGKLEEAIEAYNKALIIKPDYVTLTTTWAMLSRARQTGRGDRGLQQRLAIKPDHEAARVQNLYQSCAYL